MDNTVRGILFCLLMAVSVVTGSVLGGTWPAVVVNALSGLGAIALAVDYFVRGRRGAS